MVYFITSILRHLIHKNENLCCLCFNSVETDSVHFEDEVILVEKEVERYLKVSEILSSIFGDEVFNEISAFETLCKSCSTSTINIYKFIKEVKENMEYLHYAVEQLTNCFDMTANTKDNKTLFVNLNPNLGTTDQYYDNLKCNNISKALQRFMAFNGMTLPKIEKLSVKKEEKIPPIEKSKQDIKKAETKISALDMLHDKTNPNNIQCKECMRTFLTLSNLRNHYIRIHAPKNFKCPECFKGFGSKSYLEIHRQESHVSLVCSECGKTFQNKHTLKMHEKGHFLKLVCQDCGRVYKNHNTFKLHIDNNVCQTQTRHSQADAKFTCDYCQKKYTQKMTLRVHIQYEHLNYKYHTCKWCSKKFWCQSRLKAHIVKHTRERNFVCTICSRKFVTKESLLYHTRIHTGERPYSCPHCESRFLSSSRRAAHIKTHHMDPTVECDICHSQFRSYHYLQKHKKLHCKERKTVTVAPKRNNTEKEKKLTYPMLKVYFNRDQPTQISPDVQTKINSIQSKHRRLIVNPADIQSNIKLYYEGVSENKLTSNSNLNLHINTNEVELSDADSNIKYAYQLSEAENQNNGEKVYLLVSEDDDDEFVIKVSENVEV